MAARRPLTVRHLRDMLGAARSRAPVVASADEPPIDPVTAAHLLALGYVE